MTSVSDSSQDPEWTRPRFLLLVTLALLVFAACVWKIWIDPRSSSDSARRSERMMPAPRFAARDHLNEEVRLQRYLGRHRIALVFFDRESGLAGDPILTRLRTLGEAEDLKRGGTVVIAISDAIPQENRKVFPKGEPTPFVVLSDPTFFLQDQYGAYDEETRSTIPSIYLIDRKGELPRDDQTGRPRPLDDPNDIFQEWAP